MKIKFYEKDNGRRPVKEFLDQLPQEDNTRIIGCLESIERFGFNSPRVEFRQIRGSLWEIKIKTQKSGYRLFYACIKHINIVLLHAYKKQSQKAPKKEIEIAENRILEVHKNESSYIN